MARVKYWLLRIDPCRISYVLEAGGVSKSLGDFSIHGIDQQAFQQSFVHLHAQGLKQCN